MEDACWLFFDLGNTLISEERAWERRIERLVSSLERYGRHRAIEEVRAALREASEEFAPRLITRAIEKLIDDLECRKSMLAEARTTKSWSHPTKVPNRPFGRCRPATGSGLSRISPLAQRNG